MGLFFNKNQECEPKKQEITTDINSSEMTDEEIYEELIKKRKELFPNKKK